MSAATTKVPSSSSLGEKRLLKIKVRSQDPVGEYEFSLCATVRFVAVLTIRVCFFSLLFVLLYCSRSSSSSCYIRTFAR